MEIITAKEMTIKEALSEGYELYGEKDWETYGLLKNLNDEKLLELMGKDGDRVILLAEKECLVEGMVSADDIIGMIDENIERCEHGLESTGEVISSYHDEIQSLLDRIEKEIRDKKATKTYELTNIILIPESLKKVDKKQKIS